MNGEHVKRSFLDWLDERADANKRGFIERHLQSCDDCRSYYEKMSVMMEPPQFSAPIVLEPDPFLPTRIRALVEERGNALEAHMRPRMIQWSLATLGLTLAIGIGIFFGKGLSDPSKQQESVNVIDSYFEGFSQHSFADHWEGIFNTTQKENK